jgi:hypothetical protein
MGYNDLLKKNYYFEDSKLRTYSMFSGGIKKKNKEGGFTGMFQQSSIKFFCFHLQGKLLCYYDELPVSIFII